MRVKILTKKKYLLEKIISNPRISTIQFRAKKAYSEYLPEESAISFNAINKLSPSIQANERFTQPG